MMRMCVRQDFWQAQRCTDGVQRPQLGQLTRRTTATRGGPKEINQSLKIIKNKLMSALS